MINKIKVFLKIKFRIKILIIFIFFLTGFFRAAILLFSFKKIASFMGEEGKENFKEPKEDNLRYLKIVKWTVFKVAKNTPWDSLCLVKALTAQTLLKLKNIDHTIYLGLSKKDGELKAHAWLKCGEIYITGENGRADYSIINKYSFNS